MATLIGMSIWGIELHRISIAAIIVALGLLAQSGNPPARLGDCPSFTFSEIDVENSLP